MIIKTNLSTVIFSPWLEKLTHTNCEFPHPSSHVFGPSKPSHFVEVVQQSSINFSVIGGYTQNISGDSHDLVKSSLQMDINFIAWCSRHGFYSWFCNVNLGKKNTLRTMVFQNRSVKEGFKTLCALLKKWPADNPRIFLLSVRTEREYRRHICLDHLHC